VPRLFMCPPDFFTIAYEINPWMRRSVRSISRLAHDQWWDLFQLLTEKLGCTVELLRPQEGLPDLVFTANAGIVWGRTFVPSRFRYRERRGEEKHYRRYFEARNYQVVDLEGEDPFEGAGDALLCGEDIFFGYHFRSEFPAHEALSRLLGKRVLPLMLTDPRFYHLDTCFCPLWGGEAIFFPAAFDSYGRAVLEDYFPPEKRYAVPEEEALRFACNAVALPEHVILPSGCPRTARRIRKWGYEVHQVRLSEFMKSGGSAKCLTLLLDEDKKAG